MPIARRVSLNPDDAERWAKKQFGRTLEEALESSLVKDEKSGPARRVTVYEFPNQLYRLWRGLKTPNISTISHKQRVITRFGATVISGLREVRKLETAAEATEAVSGGMGVIYGSTKMTHADYTLSVPVLSMWSGRVNVSISNVTADELESLHHLVPLSQSHLVMLSVIAAFARSKDKVPKTLRSACRKEIRSFRLWLETVVEMQASASRDLVQLVKDAGSESALYEDPVAEDEEPMDDDEEGEEDSVGNEGFGGAGNAAAGEVENQ